LAIKYRRDEIEVEETLPRRQTPWRRVGPTPPRLTRRQALFFGLCFLASLVILGQLAGRRAFAPTGATPDLRRAEGVVERLWRGEADRGWVELALPAASGAIVRVEWPVPDPYWADLAAGDRLAVLLRDTSAADAPELVECGLVALSGPIR